MAMPAYQQVICAQVWVCDACGCKDGKSCSCVSTAHAEEIAAKREAHRQAAKRNREKTQQNQHPRDNHRVVDNIEEFPVVQNETEETWRRGLIFRAQTATSDAAFEDWSKYSVDDELIEAVAKAARAWCDVERYLRELR